jgi:hypothetical protein
MSKNESKEVWTMTAEEAADRIAELDRVYAEGFISRGELQTMKRQAQAHAKRTATPIARLINDPTWEDDLSIRNKKIEETLEVLRRVHPQSQPTSEDIAQLHDLHATHERESGREGNALASEARARRVRALPRRRAPSP